MLSIITAAALPLRDAMAQAMNLNGDWTSQYTCPSGATLPLVLRVNHVGQQISAKTTAADACLYADTLAFDGHLYGNTGNLRCGEIYDPSPLDPNDNSQSVGDYLAQSLMKGVAGPGQYAVRYAPGVIQIISPTSFVACTLVFTRAGTAPLAAQPPQNLNAAGSGPTKYYCSSDGSSYAQGMGGILCPSPKGTVPTCPHGYPCTCIDSDGSCTDGDDDWGYREPPPVAIAPPASYPYPAAGQPPASYPYPAAGQPPATYPYPAAAPPPRTYPYPAAAPAPGSYPSPAAGQHQAPQDRLSKTGREQWLQYLDAPDIKAFAMSRSSGSFGWRRGRDSIKDATEGAIEACREADCEVISINGKSKWGD